VGERAITRGIEVPWVLLAWLSVPTSDGKLILLVRNQMPVSLKGGGGKLGN
jgi:hypothetical protein